jgi:hypothetical protein
MMQFLMMGLALLIHLMPPALLSAILVEIVELRIVGLLSLQLMPAPALAPLPAIVHPSIIGRLPSPEAMPPPEPSVALWVIVHRVISGLLFSKHTIPPPESKPSLVLIVQSLMSGALSK